MLHEFVHMSCCFNNYARTVDNRHSFMIMSLQWFSDMVTHVIYMHFIVYTERASLQLRSS
jgi:hypothetical protein